MSERKSFKNWWNTIPRPFSGNKKGYKKGAMDGWMACEKIRIEENKINIDWIKKLRTKLKQKDELLQQANALINEIDREELDFQQKEIDKVIDNFYARVYYNDKKSLSREMKPSFAMTMQQYLSI